MTSYTSASTYLLAIRNRGCRTYTGTIKSVLFFIHVSVMVEVSLPGKIQAKSDQTLGFMQYIKYMYITIGQRCTYLELSIFECNTL